MRTPPLEQRDSQLLLEGLDLMADRRGRNEQLLGGGLEALELGRDLKGLQKFERRQAHMFKPDLSKTRGAQFAHPRSYPAMIHEPERSNIRAKVQSPNTHAP